MDLNGRFVSFLVVILLVLAVFGLFFGRSFRVLGSDEASVRIATADDSLQHAFKVVSDAEAAGGNVSSLMVELDEAGQYLAGAEMAYKNGDTSTATSLANACVDKAEAVASEAIALRDSASAISNAALLDNTIFSVGGAVMVILLLFFGWRLFKNHYLKRLLKMRPEAASDAEA
jgi:hypothetical protein